MQAGLLPRGLRTGQDWPGQALPHALYRRVPPSGAAGREGRGEEKQQLVIFGILTSRQKRYKRSKKKQKQKKTNIELCHPPSLTLHLSPVSPTSTTDLNSYFKAPKPVQTLSRPRTWPRPPPPPGPSKRRVPGKAPRSSGSARDPGTCWCAGHERGAGRSLCADSGKGTSSTIPTIW